MTRAVAALCLLAGCASSSAPAAESPEPPEPSQEPATPGAAAPAPPGTPSSVPAPAPAPSVSPEPPPGTKSLPAVSVRNVGLHVGGGPNDAAGKAPFLRAIEQHFPDFLRCYRLIAEPGQSGTFGVDLHIPTSGGRPRVEQPRSGLGADDFKQCVVKVFESVEFPALSRPTVVSYSLRFTVED